jgi:hypothetical protein
MLVVEVAEQLLLEQAHLVYVVQEEMEHQI